MCEAILIVRRLQDALSERGRLQPYDGESIQLSNRYVSMIEFRACRRAVIPTSAMFAGSRSLNRRCRGTFKPQPPLTLADVVCLKRLQTWLCCHDPVTERSASCHHDHCGPIHFHQFVDSLVPELMYDDGLKRMCGRLGVSISIVWRSCLGISCLHDHSRFKVRELITALKWY